MKFPSSPVRRFGICERMPSRSSFSHSPAVFRAAGMVSVQADCLVEEALIFISQRAESIGVSMDEIAAAVADGSLRFGTGSTRSQREEPA